MKYVCAFCASLWLLGFSLLPLSGSCRKASFGPCRNLSALLLLLPKTQNFDQKRSLFSSFFKNRRWHTGCLGDHRHFAFCAAHKRTKAGGAITRKPNYLLRSTN